MRARVRTGHKTIDQARCTGNITRTECCRRRNANNPHKHCQMRRFYGSTTNVLSIALSFRCDFFFVSRAARSFDDCVPWLIYSLASEPTAAVAHFSRPARCVNECCDGAAKNTNAIADYNMVYRTHLTAYNAFIHMKCDLATIAILGLGRARVCV